jgi:hypothetical protein
VSFLIEEGVADEKATIVDVQKFVEHNLKAEEIHEFYTAVRRAAHNESERARKKAKSK